MIRRFPAYLLFLLIAACSAVPPLPDGPLQDRYWRTLEIDGVPITAGNNRAEPHLVLAKELRAHGSDGCNRFNGSYALDKGLRFGQMASTMMACPQPDGMMAREFSFALAATVNYRIRGKQMELIDNDGRVRMRLEATFLK